MIFRSLRSRLVTVVFALVVGSGLLISVLVTQRYGDNLLAAATAQAENMAHALALEATDKVLTNDLIALQKMLDHQMRSGPSLAYLFVLRDGRLLAHTFSGGVPKELIGANEIASGDQGRLQRIESTAGERYLDIAWPIFSGRAGVLRLGFSEKPFRQQVRKLWLQMSLVTLGILLLALAASLVFVRRITRPIAELATATRRIDEGDLDVKVAVQGDHELAALASSFNQMVTRVKDYTGRLEKQAAELERSHKQTRQFCEIVKEIGALPTLHEIGPALILRFQSILKCRDMALLIFSPGRDALFVVSNQGLSDTRDPARIQAVADDLSRVDGGALFARSAFEPSVLPELLWRSSGLTIIPFPNREELFGGLAIACPGECHCDREELELVELILAQSAGVINRAILHEEAIHEFEARGEASDGFHGIIGKDPKMRLIYKLIEDIAPTDAAVLIQGESGTGKELVARAILDGSERKDKPFVVINCSAYPDTLLESELFGHERGAFTGAIRQKTGRFEQADHGTVFLDEIGEIPPQAQIKLLRVLQTQKFERVGGEKTLTVDVRILAATNKDLLGEVQRGAFREDLFYRLNVIPIFMPRLRERMFLCSPISS
jgi:HAMP domain-containing protein